MKIAGGRSLVALIAITLLAVGVFDNASGHSSSVTVPSFQASAEGNTLNCMPLGCGTSRRYQQLYSASEFTITEPHLVTAIAFRGDNSSGPFAKNHGSVQINLSTSPRSVDQMSWWFAQNTGTDDTVVHNGPLSLSSGSGPQVGPKPFDVVIPLQTAFQYDPANGDLLLDVRVFDGDTVSPDAYFDAQITYGDGVSRAYAWSVDATNAYGGPNVNTVGLVTQFSFEPLDVTPPVINLSVQSDTLWPPNHKMKDVGLSVSVVDDTDPEPVYSIDITSSEPVDGVGDGRTDPDVSWDGERLLLRAERLSNGTGRAYVVEVTATDAAGNQAAEQITILVPLNQSRRK